MSSFGKRLKVEREKMGCSVEDFGRIGGVSITAQYNYEKGVRNPDIQYLSNIANAGCDVQYVITGNPSTDKISKEEADFLDLYRTAERSYQKASIQVLKTEI